MIKIQINKDDIKQEKKNDELKMLNKKAVYE